MQDLTVKLVKITNGRLSVKTAGESQLKVLEKVNIEIKDFAANASFPISFSADIQGGGEVKMDGRAGPVDTNDASETPFDVTIKLNKLDIAKAGFVRPSTGFEGLVSIDGSVSSSAHILQLKGSIQAEHLKLAKAGKPATKTVGFDFVLNNDLRQRSGALTRGDVHIGKATARTHRNLRHSEQQHRPAREVGRARHASGGTGRHAAGARYRFAAGFVA